MSWGNTYPSRLTKVQTKQNKCIRCIFFSHVIEKAVHLTSSYQTYSTKTTFLDLKSPSWPTKSHKMKPISLKYFKHHLIKASDIHSHNTRYALNLNFHVPRVRSNCGKHAWKHYLHHLLKRFGGLFLFHCNYDIKDLTISSKFYSELLQWWAEFRDEFSTEKLWPNVIWNNKDICINNRPIFYKTYFESGFIEVTDLLFDFNITESFNTISKKIDKTNFLVCAGLRHAIPSHLKSKSKTDNHTFLAGPPSLIINNNAFDILRKKSKDYYTLIISKKAQFSKHSLVLKRDFNLSEDQLEKVFILPHIVCSEPYVKAFQYKVLNFILYTNTKLYKIGFITDNKCSFCKSEPETLLHLLFDCVYSKRFWKDFEFYFYSLSKEFFHLSWQDVLIGIISSECPLLNYFLLIAKLYLWDCRRSQILPCLTGFKVKIKIKFETEKYICTQNNTLIKFNKKWATICPL